MGSQAWCNGHMAWCNGQAGERRGGADRAEERVEDQREDYLGRGR